MSSRTYGTAIRVGDAWSLSVEPHVAMRLKRAFAKIDVGAHGSLRLRHTPETCRELRWFFERFPLDITDEDFADLHAGAEEHIRLGDTVEEILSGDYVPEAYDLALPPRGYQRVAADLCLSGAGLLLGDDMGIGKTVSAICVLSDPRARPTLVCTLTHLPRQIAAEIAKFAPRLRVHVIRSGQPYDIIGWERKQAKRQGLTGRQIAAIGFPDVVIISYSKLSGWADALAPLMRGNIWDEVQELRHPGTDKYRAAKYFSESAAIRLGLSATPIYNYGSESYSVLDVLHPGALGDRDEFHREWCHGVDDKGRALIKDPPRVRAMAARRRAHAAPHAQGGGARAPGVLRGPPLRRSRPQGAGRDRREHGRARSDHPLAGWLRLPEDEGGL